MFTNGITLVPTENDDEKFFIKCDEIWNKITVLIGINNSNDFVETYDDDYNDDDDDDDDEDEFIGLKKIQVLLEIKIEMILYLFLYVLLIIHLKHHKFNTDINTHKYTN